MRAQPDTMEATRALLRSALLEQQYGSIAIVSSFGTDSAVLLDLVARTKRDAPVLFINTHMLFEETLDYKAKLIRHLGLTNVQTISPSGESIRANDIWGRLHLTDADACCDFRKTRVLDAALARFDGWITGRKRYQALTRSDVMPVEKTASGKTKLNPLAAWSADEIRNYAIALDLPHHPLIEHGYKSVGCASCTSPVKAGENDRAGRWRSSTKTECGIHFENGKPVRGAINNATD